MNFRQAIEKTASFWLPEPTAVRIVGQGDANTFDVWWLMRHFIQLLELDLPTNLPPKEVGIKIALCADENFIEGIIRFLTTEKLVQRADNLIRELDVEELLPNLNKKTQFAIALSIWYGCICMSKLLRQEDAGNNEISNEVREFEYERLKGEWEFEQSRGNPWVRYGVTLAKDFEIPRATRENRAFYDEWVVGVDPNSPYLE